MQSPRPREHYHKHKERKQEDESPTTTTEEDKEEEEEVKKQIGDIFESTTPLTTVKNKKRVHYPQINGERSVTTDSLQKNHETSSVDLYSKTINGRSKKPTTGDHVIPIESERRSCCCSIPESLRRRLQNSLAPWKEFIEYQSNWSWVILVASFLTYSIGEALTSVFPILFVALQDEFPDQGSSRVALVQSMMNAVPCLAGPIASITTTRFGYRKTAMLGGFIGSLSLLATSFARRLELLYITMGVCYAFGNSLVLVATVVAVTEHFEAKPSFASGVTISGGAFGQCVFAIVLQKLIDKYDWNGAMMLFSGIVLSIVAFAALFREVEWDEEDYDEEEGEDEEIENGNETTSTALSPSEQSENPVETTHSAITNQEAEEKIINPTSNTPLPGHRPSITDDMFFYDHFTKQELLDQYSKSEICLPLAVREHLEDEYRQHRIEQEERNFGEPILSSSTTQLEQTDEIHRATEVPTIGERSNSCKDLLLTETTPLTSDKPIRSIVPSTTTTTNNSRKARSHNRRQHRSSTNTPHDNKQLIIYYPFHRQHHNIPIVAGGSTRPHSSHHHHHHHHHHHSLHCNRGNLSQLALCSKNIYNYESVLNICKLQSLHFSIDRSLSLPNLYSPILAGKKRHRSLTVSRNIEDYLKEEEEEDEDEIEKKSFFEQICHDVGKLLRVLRILPFLLLCICVTMITIFYDATWTFLIDYMKKNDLSAEKGSHLIFSVGIVAIFGEIGYGYMGDSKRISPLHVYACSLCLAGLSQLLIPLVIKSYSILMPLMVFTSFLQSAQEVLMPILCIKFAGTQNFTNAYGMLLLCQGISSLIGPPALGFVADLNSYALTYFVIGIGTALAALLLFTMPLVQKCYGFLTLESKKQKTNTLVTASNGDLPVPIPNNNSLNETIANINK
ncbi:unnamed protein product [Rotaria sordida]|uniref:Major facilitator superfamily (MFS) profile domain-containing protein n=1 Tax=Rotaria sordida TaxID=392033 RepID=A0A818KUD4_9BILA|nr:unnamed protein product [Rotaria sordida]CAF3559732.1 unnamed protein product [Rotaria sordida]